jgi:hypothetical protein
MEFEEFKSHGLRVTQEFHDQYLGESADPRLKSSPPPPFMRYTTYKGFVVSQINFASKREP